MPLTAEQQQRAAAWAEAEKEKERRRRIFRRELDAEHGPIPALIAYRADELPSVQFEPRTPLLYRDDQVLLYSGQIAEVFARRGDGKTWFLLTLALLLAYGRRAMGLEARTPRLDTPEGQQAIEPFVNESDVVMFDNRSCLFDPQGEKDPTAWRHIRSSSRRRRHAHSSLWLGRSSSRRSRQPRERRGRWPHRGCRRRWRSGLRAISDRFALRVEVPTMPDVDRIEMHIAGLTGLVIRDVGYSQMVDDTADRELNAAKVALRQPAG